MAKTVKMILTNSSDKPLLMMLEPWGRDFTLAVREKIEIITEDCDENFYYDICYENDYVAVIVEGGHGYDPQVLSNGIEIFCGYNRELSPAFFRDDILEAGELE